MTSESIYTFDYSSPLGPLSLGIYREKLCYVSFDGIGFLQKLASLHSLSLEKGKELPSGLRSELDEYFQGRLQHFRFPTEFLGGTAFEQKVWRALLEIPFGRTESYAALAKRIGHPKALRAVGRANGQNRISIVVPCHRVISSNGGLGGYAGGLQVKERLLYLEGNQL